MIIGRERELKILESSLQSKKSELIVLYGRRRIGKSFLLQSFASKHPALSVEGLEKQHSPVQINNFLQAMSQYYNDPLILKMKLTSWNEVFDLLTQKLDQPKKTNKKTIIILDEFQWMASNQTKLISYLKNYWDNKWKHRNVLLILCGSVAHYMVKKIIHSKALYGRINHEINLLAFQPVEAQKFLPKKGSLEVLYYLLIFGGVPKYLELIDQKKSLGSNLNFLCFQKDSYFLSEPDKIFFSQFKEARTYKRIIEYLAKGNYSLKEISLHLKIPSGGGLKSYLENLEKASFIRSYTSFQQKGNRSQKYKLFDEFLTFYYKYMKSKINLLREMEEGSYFEKNVEPFWTPWLGIAFENFCLRNALLLAKIGRFQDEVISYSPLYELNSNRFQIDLIYTLKNHTYVVCEIKFHKTQVGTWIIPEFNKKLNQLKLKGYETVQKLLVAPLGQDKSLQESEYFDLVITIEDIFK